MLVQMEYYNVYDDDGAIRGGYPAASPRAAF